MGVVRGPRNGVHRVSRSFCVEMSGGGGGLIWWVGTPGTVYGDGSVSLRPFEDHSVELHRSDRSLRTHKCTYSGGTHSQKPELRRFCSTYGVCGTGTVNGVCMVPPLLV